MSAWREEFDACVTSAFQRTLAAEGRDYTIVEIDDLLYELAVAGHLLTRQLGSEAAMVRALMRVMEKKAGEA